METHSGEPTWEKFISDGEKYLSTAINGYKKRENIFTPDIIYHIVCMSIESNVMGFLFYNNHMADNHTLVDLVNAVKEITEVDQDLCQRIISMNRFQESVCSLSAQIMAVPKKSDIKAFLSIGESVQDFVAARLPLKAEPETVH